MPLRSSRATTPSSSSPRPSTEPGRPPGRRRAPYDLPCPPEHERAPRRVLRARARPVPARRSKARDRLPLRRGLALRGPPGGPHIRDGKLPRADRAPAPHRRAKAPGPHHPRAMRLVSRPGPRPGRAGVPDYDALRGSDGRIPCIPGVVQMYCTGGHASLRHYSLEKSVWLCILDSII
ncbi:hypothetical protein SAMN04488571_1172 [Methanoculleus thermophilus]|uniref:Uncharacterized protein n=1 Tax=Methanoculleus thermophilus TaxID=2200 RepID=A0A1G9CFT4_9EURY|nr:hypothetical protein SAMN04488571_1172 [Methanoculleus thermophilus]